MMRNSRNALIATTVLCAFAVATYACGGDDDNSSIPNNNSSSSSTSGNLSSTSSSTGGLGTSSSSSSSGTSGTTSSSSTSSSGNPGSSSGQTPADAGEVGDASEIPDSGGLIPDSGTTFDGAAGSLCQLNSVQEQEVNDTTPNTIPGKTGTFCGSLSSSSDKDLVSFTLPADAVTLDISNQTNAAGFQLAGTVSVGGNTQTFALNGNDAGNFPFVPGGVYTLTATSTANAAIDYIIGITITEQAAVSKCAQGSQPEVEPNDTDGNATPVTLTNGAASWCGVIASPTDVDEFQFTMPSGFTKLSTNFSTSGAALGISITDNGTAVADPTSIPIHAGDKYIFKFTANATNDAYLYTFTLSN